MKRKLSRVTILLGLLLAIAAFVSAALVYHWQHLGPKPKDFAKLPGAILSYSRDRVSRGQSLPASITLRDLTDGGYISPEYAHKLGGINLTIFPSAGETNPQSILMRARMSDGSEIVALADGSTQVLTTNAVVP
jgi:hypothetical protein